MNYPNGVRTEMALDPRQYKGRRASQPAVGDARVRAQCWLRWLDPVCSASNAVTISTARTPREAFAEGLLADDRTSGNTLQVWVRRHLARGTGRISTA